MPIRASSLFGLRNQLLGRRYIVDFCDLNATKALHIGHLRNLALGHALASLLSSTGGAVTKQSVVCDIGRNVCEALAGYLQFDAGNAPRDDEKGDSFVGRYYAAYNAANSISEIHSDIDPDSPIARELSLHNDLADEILANWRSGDAVTHATWRRLLRWVLDGQNATLARLGIEFDQFLYESESLDLITGLLDPGLSNRILQRLDDGGVAYPTGREFYHQLILLRSDGFRTEHMRALPLWERMQRHGHLIEACVHVMGKEWVLTTELREEILRSLGPCPLFDRYHKVAHGMVRPHGSKRKSSSGEALLIDDAIAKLLLEPIIDDLFLRSRRLIEPEVLCRIALPGCFFGKSK